MRTKNNYKIEKESLEEQIKSKRYNPALVLLYRDRFGNHRVTLDAGYYDDVGIYREKNFVYALSINQVFGYCGLQMFEKGEEVGSIFLQNDNDVESVLGKNGLELSYINIAKRLKEYL